MRLRWIWESGRMLANRVGLGPRKPMVETQPGGLKFRRFHSKFCGEFKRVVQVRLMKPVMDFQEFVKAGRFESILTESGIKDDFYFGGTKQNEYLLRYPLQVSSNSLSRKVKQSKKGRPLQPPFLFVFYPSVRFRAVPFR